MEHDFDNYKVLIKDTLDFDRFIEHLLKKKPYKNSKIEIAKIEQPKSFPAIIHYEFYEDNKKDDWIFYRWTELKDFESCMPKSETSFSWVKSKLETWIAARIEKFGNISESNKNKWCGLILKELREDALTDEIIIGNCPEEIEFKV